MERRHFNGEVRSQDIDGQKYLVGYAAKFGVQSRDLGGFQEVVERRAFDRAINEKQNVLCRIDHDRARILGTTKGGTLTLSPDDTGLAFRCLLPDTSYARDCVELMKRGDGAECSFGFQVPRGGDKWGIEKGVNVRHLVDVDLFEVSVGVTHPAYPETEVALRSMQEWIVTLPTPKLAMAMRNIRLREHEERAWSDEARKAALEARKAGASASRKASEASDKTGDKDLSNKAGEADHAAQGAQFHFGQMANESDSLNGRSPSHASMASNHESIGREHDQKASQAAFKSAALSSKGDFRGAKKAADQSTAHKNAAEAHFKARDAHTIAAKRTGEI